MKEMKDKKPADEPDDRSKNRVISSTSNKQVKQVNSLLKKAKTRREEDLFVAEGLRICREIPKDRICAIYMSESFARQAPAETFYGIAHTELVTDEVFRALSDTQTPQGILALVKQSHYSLQDLMPDSGKPALILAIERLQDPGNLGTIIRAGEGAGVTGILMDRETADIYNPKVIRATMGSVFRVPFIYADDWKQSVLSLKSQGVRVFAAHLKGSESYDEEDYTGPSAFMIGNEAGGLTEEAASLADVRLKIPMLGKVESLNAAVASSVLMFEAARQRRRKM